MVAYECAFESILQDRVRSVLVEVLEPMVVIPRCIERGSQILGEVLLVSLFPAIAEGKELVRCSFEP